MRLWALLPLLASVVLGVGVLASPLPPLAGILGGAAASLVAVLAMLELVGSFDDPVEPAAEVGLRALLGPGFVLLAVALAAVVALRGAVGGYLSATMMAVVAPGLWLGLLVAGHRLAVAAGLMTRGERLLERSGFWVLALAGLLYLPTLGGHGLSDPWETHYGEVSREILARGDWISLWWAQDGWFWSKPVLTFWLEALAMALLGVRYEPGRMLSAVGEGRLPAPEWAVRLPVFLVAVIGVYVLYEGVRASHGRRAGLLGAVLLMAAPQWALLAHQGMTDMPFLGFMAAAMGFTLAAMVSDPEAAVTRYGLRLGRRGFRLSGYHLVVGAILLCVVPQCLYLASRNLTLGFAPFHVGFVADHFASGSPGACGTYGNAICETGIAPRADGFQPLAQALLWLQCAGLVLWLAWGERRRQRLLMLAAWLCVALASMAKGPAGLGLPVLATAVYLVATGRLRELSRMEIAAGALIFVSVALPWIVAMYMRHGPPFTDRLLVHDMFKRAFRHVHDTNEGDDTSFRYYIWQLGYATFPWVGLAPMAAVRWLRRDGVPRDPDRERRFTGEVLLGAWLLVGFALFSVMGTKFHHYGAPLVPPLAMLSGIFLAERWRDRDGSDEALFGGASLVVAAVVVLAVGRDLAWRAPGRLSEARLFHLVTYAYDRPWPTGLDHHLALWLFTGAAALALGAMIALRLRRRAAMLVLAVSLGFGAWLLDVYLPALSPHYGQRELFLRYEREQARDPGPIIAYQMNWKGENFYRGNEVVAFVSTGRLFQDHVASLRTSGVRTMYFVTQPKRLDSLRAEIGVVPESLSTPEENNKFLLLRVHFPP